jgi:hypothetical protein
VRLLHFQVTVETGYHTQTDSWSVVARTTTSDGRLLSYSQFVPTQVLDALPADQRGGFKRREVVRCVQKVVHEATEEDDGL